MIKEFKKLAKSILEGELSGYFLTRNGDRILSSHLHANNINQDMCFSEQYPYCIQGGHFDGATYTENGYFWKDMESGYDLVSFFPNAESVNKKQKEDMNTEKRTVEITLEQAMAWYKEGGELRDIALQSFTEEELTPSKPMSWEEFVKLKKGFDGVGIDWNCEGGFQTTGLHHRGDAILPTMEGYQMLHFMRLINLRKEWIGDWKPCWDDGDETKYCVIYYGKKLKVDEHYNHVRTLSFPTYEMADEFIKTFRHELELAGELI